MPILSQETKAALDTGFAAAFGGEPTRYFCAPGRTEICGNHTDHQHGRVLAAAVELDTRAAVRPNGSGTIRVCSAGYPMSVVELWDLSVRQEEKNTTSALIRGVAARFRQLGREIGGFDAYVESTVLPGSGLSSSAAFEVLMGTVLNGLFDGGFTPEQIAAIGQYAENVHFGKPCGLMDQMASAVGGLVAIDFLDKDHPAVHPIAVDLSAWDHALCIIDTHASHADLTDDYAAIPAEMSAICAHFGKKVLTQVDEQDFFAAIPALRQRCGDRAVLRAIHFYSENARVPRLVSALEAGDFDTFLHLIRESGRSSYMYLQNVIPAGATAHQDVALALALCEHYLQGRGACRVHGGGFAGTVQAFVPIDLLAEFRSGLDAALGKNACRVLRIRPRGAAELAQDSANQ